MHILLMQFFTVSGLRLLRIPIAMVFLSLLYRIIGPEGVGNWSIIIAVSVFFNSVVFSWMQAQAVRKGRDEWLNRNKLSNTWASRQPLIVVGLIITFLIFLGQPFYFFEKITHLPESFGWLSFAHLIGILLLTEAQIIQQTTGKIARYAAYPVLIDIIIVCFIALLLIVKVEMTSIQIILGVIVLTAVFSGLIWYKEFIASYSWGGVTSDRDIRQIILHCGPVTFAALMGFSSDWCDHFLLQFFHNAKEVGLFQSGYQVMLAMMAMASPIAVIFLPELIDRLRVDPKAVRNYVQVVIPVVALIWLLFIIPCITFMPWMFSFAFGTQFQEAQSTMLILSIAVPGAIFTYLYTIIFNIQGRFMPQALFIGAMALINFIISFALVPTMGSSGAAIGTAVSYLAVQILYIVNQHRYIIISLTAPISLFSVGLFFGVVQLFIGNELICRIVLAILCIFTIVLLGRGFCKIQARAFSTLLPKNIAWIGRLLDLLLIKQKNT